MTTMSCGVVLSHCVSCVSSVSASRGVTVATHVDEYLAAAPALAADEVAAATVREAVYGVVRCRPLLALTVDGLYARHAADAARSDRVLYELLCWLAVFGLKQLGLAEFRRFALAVEAHKAHTLLSFLWDPALQDEWLAAQWSTLYDPAHVQDVLLGHMRQVAPQMNALVSELHAKLVHSSSAATSEAGMAGVTRVAAKASTVPEPFALTKPKVRMLPAPPLVMTATYKASAIPAAVYENSLKTLEQEAAQRRRDTEQAVARRHAAARPPTLSTQARGQTVHVGSEKLRQELEAAEKAAVQPVRARPLPAVRPVAPAKLTTAAILREDLLYKRRLEEAAAAAAKFESELRDESDFHAWQLKMEAADEEARAREVQQRKLDMQQAQLDAVAAMQAHAYAKHEAVVALKEERAEISAEMEAAMERDRLAKRGLVAKVSEAKAAIPLAVAEVAKRKVELAEEVVQAREAAAQAKRREAARDLAQKKALIRQIQAMEKLAAARARKPKEVDPTATGGLGLLDEMSLVELQERQVHLAAAEAAFLAEKRARISEDKARKAEVLGSMQRNLVRMRRDMAAEASERKLGRTAALDEAARAAAAKAQADALVLADRLLETQQMRRTEALRLAAELKSKKIQNEFYAQTKANLARERGEDLARAARRVDASEAVKALEIAQAAQAVKYEAERNRARADKARTRARVAVRSAAEQTLASHRAEGAQLDREDALAKSIQRREIAAAVAAQTEAHRMRNPYAASVADREARRAARISAAAAAAAAAPDTHSAAHDRDDEFAASQRMAELDVQQQIAQLSFQHSDEEKEEDYPSGTATTNAAPALAASASASAAPTSSTLKRASMSKSASGAKSSARSANAKSATTKALPLAAHA